LKAYKPASGKFHQYAVKKTKACASYQQDTSTTAIYMEGEKQYFLFLVINIEG
jgi:hypothetical protein